MPESEEEFRMNRRILMLVSGTLLLPLGAQEAATTASGKKVLLYSDGTWKADGKLVAPGAVSQAGIPKAATAKASICKGKASLFYNPKKWKPKGEETGGRSAFEHADGDANAIIITERIEIPTESLETVALTNAKNAAPDAQITFKESRVVNGAKVEVIALKGTIAGIKFQYFGYYVSGAFGTIQAITYTSQNLFEEYKADFVDFLNGLVLAP
jgi:hypothetical protein